MQCSLYGESSCRTKENMEINRSISFRSQLGAKICQGGYTIWLLGPYYYALLKIINSLNKHPKNL